MDQNSHDLAARTGAPADMDLLAVRPDPRTLLTAVPYPDVEGVRFADVPGFSGYCVGDDGTVWSRRRKFSGRKNVGVLANTWTRLRHMFGMRGYSIVTLCGGRGKSSIRAVHILVLSTFVGPRPSGMFGCHNNGDASDNRLENLRWDTPKANSADSARHGTQVRGERQPLAKLTEAAVREIRRQYARGEPVLRLARLFGVSRNAIRGAALGRHWKHVEAKADNPPQSRSDVVKRLRFLAGICRRAGLSRVSADLQRCAEFLESEAT